MKIKTAIQLGALSLSLVVNGFGQTSGPAILQVESAAYYTWAAPGGLATIWGTGLSDAAYVATTRPLPTQLGPTSLQVCTVTAGPQSCVPAKLLYVSPTQINFVVPATDYTGLPASQDIAQITSAIKLTVGSQTTSAPAEMISAAPQMFGEGSDCNYDPLWADTAACGIVAAQLPSPSVNRAAITDLNGTLVSSGNPAKLGQYYSIYLTGIRLDNSGQGPGMFGDVGRYTVNLTLNRRPNDPLQSPYSFSVIPTYAGPSSFDGVQQINFVVNAADVPLSIVACQDLKMELAVAIAIRGNVSTFSNFSIPVFVKSGELACQ